MLLLILFFGRKNIVERQIQLLVCLVTRGAGADPGFEEYKAELAKTDNSVTIVFDQSDVAGSVAKLEDSCLKLASIHYAAKLKVRKREIRNREIRN